MSGMNRCLNESQGGECLMNEGWLPQCSASFPADSTFHAALSILRYPRKCPPQPQPWFIESQNLHGPPGAPSLFGYLSSADSMELAENWSLPGQNFPGTWGKGKGTWGWGLLLHRGLAGWLTRQRALRKLPSNLYHTQRRLRGLASFWQGACWPCCWERQESGRQLAALRWECCKSHRAGIVNLTRLCKEQLFRY